MPPSNVLVKTAELRRRGLIDGGSFLRVLQRQALDPKPGQAQIACTAQIAALEDKYCRDLKN